MNLSLEFAPHVAPFVLWGLVGLAVLLSLYLVAVRARGAWARALALAVVLLALANPLMVRETREALPDVVALIVDRTQSMDVGTRRKDADAAAAEFRKAIAADKTLELREAAVDTKNAADDTGTQAFAALGQALADVPPERLAGAILITDGEVHDAPAGSKPAIKAPLQVLIAGNKNETDRKLTIESASRFAIVGQNADIALKVDDFGRPAGGSAEVDIRVDGVPSGTYRVETGKASRIDVPVTHGGENVIELEARPGPGELTLQNNRAVVTVSGVRDRLRVLLVSGEPHAGERVWRTLLKADPSVDMVHFTILRPPDKQDLVPQSELSLIQFPTRELFVEKLSGFDLVIFDRYSERGILPLAYFVNIARYVENGGALLVAAGPEYAGFMSVYRTPLSVVLPAQPDGQVIDQPFKPQLTQPGMAHPVTRDLQGANTANTPPTWGRWFRTIGAEKVSGETLMSGAGGRPLLVLDRVGKGRVAELLSDQGWLWARGFEGGGPQAELLRRLAHWSMKEPELEEERLSASVADGEIVVDRRTMADSAAPVEITYPSGKKSTLDLAKIEPGHWRASAKAEELGLYRLTDGKLTAVTAAGPLNPKEVADMRATDSILAQPARMTGGSVHWLVDGLPSLRRTDPEDSQFGRDWIGLKQNNAYRVTSVEQQALLPPWLALVLLLSVLLLAWRIEGR